jgi:hypothetical protein
MRVLAEPVSASVLESGSHAGVPENGTANSADPVGPPRRTATPGDK